MTLKKLIVFSVLTAGGAQGQSTIAAQKACYDQSVKISEENHATSFRNRYDAATDKCWLFVDMSNPPDPNMFITVGDAFQRQWTATFTGPQYTGRTPLMSCDVDGIQCRNMSEFRELVKKRYGL